MKPQMPSPEKCICARVEKGSVYMCVCVCVEEKKRGGGGGGALKKSASFRERETDHY